jgi:hypothetical protein
VSPSTRSSTCTQTPVTSRHQTRLRGRRLSGITRVSASTEAILSPHIFQGQCVVAFVAKKNATKYTPTSKKMQSLHSELLHSLGYCNECAHLLVRACIQSRQISRAAAEYLWSQVFVVIAAANCNETVMKSLSSMMSKRWIKESFAIYIVNKSACVCVCVSALAT